MCIFSAEWYLQWSDLLSFISLWVLPVWCTPRHFPRIISICLFFIFLAFALSYPDMQVLFMMIIPIKIKWLAWLDAAYILYDLVRGNWAIRTVIIASLLNFIIFFLATRNFSSISPKEVHRRQQFQKAVHPKMAPGITKHKCAVCGRTEKDGDDLEFRFCSKCNGNYEYCQDHLFTHQHIKWQNTQWHLH